MITAQVAAQQQQRQRATQAAQLQMQAAQVPQNVQRTQQPQQQAGQLAAGTSPSQSQQQYLNPQQQQQSQDVAAPQQANSAGHPAANPTTGFPQVSAAVDEQGRIPLQTLRQYMDSMQRYKVIESRSHMMKNAIQTGFLQTEDGTSVKPITPEQKAHFESQMLQFQSVLGHFCPSAMAVS